MVFRFLGESDGAASICGVFAPQRGFMVLSAVTVAEAPFFDRIATGKALA